MEHAEVELKITELLASPPSVMIVTLLQCPVASRIQNTENIDVHPARLIDAPGMDVN